MKRISYIVLLLLLISSSLMAQVNVVFIPEVYGRNINGLFNCTIFSSAPKLTASLKITVTERNAGTICTIKTPDFTVATGSNPVPLSATHSAAIAFGGNKLAQITSQTRNFPEGDYDYCYELTFKNTDNAPLNQCFSYALAPFADLSLIDPSDKDSICTKRPVLTWQPLLPGIPGAYYQVVVSEIKQGQRPVEALNYNMPIVNQNQVQSPVLPYPAIAKELETGKRYAWQVTAYKDQTILVRSDVWEFKVSCPDSIKKVISPVGYRDIEDLTRGNYYIANGSVRFAFVNAYEAQGLKYEITAVNKIDRQIKRLPKVKIENGRNQIDIDLTDVSGIKDNNYYIMNITLPDGGVKSLRFLYHEPKN